MLLINAALGKTKFTSPRFESKRRFIAINLRLYIQKFIHASYMETACFCGTVKWKLIFWLKVWMVFKISVYPVDAYSLRFRYSCQRRFLHQRQFVNRNLVVQSYGKQTRFQSLQNPHFTDLVFLSTKKEVSLL